MAAGRWISWWKSSPAIRWTERKTIECVNKTIAIASPCLSVCLAGWLSAIPRAGSIFSMAKWWSLSSGAINVSAVVYSCWQLNESLLTEHNISELWLVCNANSSPSPPTASLVKYICECVCVCFCKIHSTEKKLLLLRMPLRPSSFGFLDRVFKIVSTTFVGL